MCYIRLLLVVQYLTDLWNRVFLVAVVTNGIDQFIILRGKFVKLQLYPCEKANGFLIGDSYFTTDQQYAIALESPEDQD